MVNGENGIFNEQIGEIKKMKTKKKGNFICKPCVRSI